MPRKKKPEQLDLPVPAEQRPTNELWRFLDYYNKNVKAHSASECSGVIRNIQRLIDKGLGVDSLATALENYANDEWRKANPRYSKHIRSFFSLEVITEWLTPRPPIVKPMDKVAKFRSDERPAPAIPVRLDDQPQDDL